MRQPTPKVSRSRLTDGIVAVPAAMMTPTATKVNKGMGSVLVPELYKVLRIELAVVHNPMGLCLYVPSLLALHGKLGDNIIEHGFRLVLVQAEHMLG